MTGSRGLWPAAAALAVYACLAIPSARVTALYDHEAWHAETTLCLVDAKAAPGLAFWGDLPWMRDSYNGALKTYLLYLPFKLLGPSVGTLRLATVGFGAIALVLIVLLVARLYGDDTAAIAGLVLASDPALILSAAFDVGPQILMLALKMGALLALAAWRERDDDARPPAAAGLLLGLALWDKAHFTWLLVALAAVGAFFFRREPALRQARSWAWFVAGFALGCLPLLIYNVVVHPAGTLASPGHWLDARTHLSHLAAALSDRWQSLLSALEGSQSWNQSGTEIDRSYLLARRATLAALTLLAVIAARHEAWRHALFWLSLSAFVFALAVVSPLPVKFHHLFLVYPFPHLALASLLSVAAPRPSARAARGAAAAACCALTAWQCWLVAVRFPREYRRTGGNDYNRVEIAEVVGRLNDYHRRHPGAPIVAAEELARRLRFYTRGRVPFAVLPREGDSAPMRPRVQSLIEGAGGLAVLLIPDSGGLSENTRSALRWSSLEASPLASIARRDGSPWVGLFQLSSFEPRRRARAADELSALRTARAQGKTAVLAGMLTSLGSSDFWLEAARGDLESGDRKSSLTALERAGASAKTPAQRRGVAEAWIAAARERRDAGDREAASRALRSASGFVDDAESRRRVERDSWLEGAQSALEGQDPARTERALRRAQELAVASTGDLTIPRTWLLLAQLELRLGDGAAAGDALQEALPLADDPSERAALAREWLALARKELDGQRKASATRALRRAEPLLDRPDEQRETARLWSSAGYPSLAAGLLSRVEPTFAADAGYWIERAQAAIDGGLAPDAARALRRAAPLARDPARRLEVARRWLDLAKQAAEIGDGARAEEALRQAADLGLDDELWRKSAVIEQDLGRRERALTIFDRLIAKTPDDAVLYANRGLCRYLDGGSRDATEDLRRAMRLDPTYLPAALSLGAIYELQGRGAEAMKIYRATDSALRSRPPPKDALKRALLSEWSRAKRD